MKIIIILTLFLWSGLTHSSNAYDTGKSYSASISHTGNGLLFKKVLSDNSAWYFNLNFSYFDRRRIDKRTNENKNANFSVYNGYRYYLANTKHRPFFQAALGIRYQLIYRDNYSNKDHELENLNIQHRTRFASSMGIGYEYFMSDKFSVEGIIAIYGNYDAFVISSYNLSQSINYAGRSGTFNLNYYW